MDEGVAGATRQFPARANEIEGLAARNEEFREICMDFAEAKTELARWEPSMDSKRGERRSMYEELVAALAKEIEDALDDGAA